MGNNQIVTTELDSIGFTETVSDSGDNIAKVNVKVKAIADTTLTGAFLGFDLPAEDFSGAKIELIEFVSINY